MLQHVKKLNGIADLHESVVWLNSHISKMFFIFLHCDDGCNRSGIWIRDKQEAMESVKKVLKLYGYSHS